MCVTNRLLVNHKLAEKALLELLQSRRNLLLMAQNSSDRPAANAIAAITVVINSSIIALARFVDMSLWSKACPFTDSNLKPALLISSQFQNQLQEAGAKIFLVENRLVHTTITVL